jgi:NAD-dependent deacetylase
VRERKGKLKGIVTQNIDTLHQKAGSKNVLEMHGSFWKGHCLQTHEEFSYEQMKEMIYKQDIPKSSCGGVIKPDIVFFGENVKYYAESFQLAELSDLFIVIGSSCVVQPAASLPLYAPGKVAVINRDKVQLNIMNLAFHAQEDIDQFFKKVARCIELPVSHS